MPVDHKEIAFEAAIEHHLLTKGGYSKGDPSAYDAKTALFPDGFLSFVQETQPEHWEHLQKIKGSDASEHLVGRFATCLGFGA
jgi:type I restriction enzyme R subunit